MFLFTFQNTKEVLVSTKVVVIELTAMTITTLLSCSSYCHHKFIMRWIIAPHDNTTRYSQWMRGECRCFFPTMYLRFTYSMFWKLQYCQAIGDLIKIFFSEIMPLLFCHFLSFLNGWHFSALTNCSFNSLSNIQNELYVILQTTVS